MKTFSCEYHHDELRLKGFVAVPENKVSAPGVLIAPSWAGRDEFVKEKAKALAELGYVGFALDLYGNAKVGSGPEENARLMTPLVENRALLRQRMNIGLQTLKGLAEVDSTRTAAIGFCFGGLCVLDLARSGADVRGVVSFHGLLGLAPQLPTEIQTKVLVLHGHDDPMVPPEQVLAFEQEMTDARADWQIHVYGGVKHAFTNPLADDEQRGTVYNSAADHRSWQAMKSFLREIFAE